MAVLLQPSIYRLSGRVPSSSRPYRNRSCGARSRVPYVFSGSDVSAVTVNCAAARRMPTGASTLGHH